MVEAFGIQRTANIANKLLANTGRLKGTDLSPQALVNHAARGIKTHTCELFAQLAGNSQRSVYAVVVKVNQSDTCDRRVNIFIKCFGSSDSVTLVGSNQCMGDSAQTLAACCQSIGIGRKAVNAANQSCIAVGFLSLVNIIACREEKHRLAVGSLHYAANIGSNAALACQNTQIQCFQMRKVGIIAFDSHNGFPFVNLFAVTQGMNFDSFRMESTLAD